MTTLVAIGAAIAVLTGVGAGVGIVLLQEKLQKLLQDSRKQKAKSANL